LCGFFRIWRRGGGAGSNPNSATPPLWRLPVGSGLVRRAASEGSWFEPSEASSMRSNPERSEGQAAKPRSQSSQSARCSAPGKQPGAAPNLPSARISCMIPTGKGVEANQGMAVRRVRTPVDIHRKGRLLSPDIPRFLLNNNNLRAHALRSCIIAGVLGPIFNIGRFRLPFSS